MLVPGIEGGESSSRRVDVDMGSTVSWPLWIAAKTERRVSQFNDGARSRRTVGSLRRLKISIPKTIP